MSDSVEEKKNAEANSPQQGEAECVPFTNDDMSDEPNTLSDLKKKLALAETKADQHYDALLRAQAELENTRRRHHDEIARAHKYGLEQFAPDLLPVMDSMRATLNDDSSDFNKMREGVALTMKQLCDAFAKVKIQELNPAAGEKFDPHAHQAISMTESEQDANTIVSVLQRGYRLEERILRPAWVVVAQKKS